MKMEKREERIWEMLQEGDPEGGFALAEELSVAFPGDPGIRLALCAAAMAVDQPDLCKVTAKQGLSLVAQSNDLPADEVESLSAEFQLYIAEAAWRLWGFKEAERMVRTVLDGSPDWADAWALLARILELTGRTEDALAADQRAAELEPEEYPLPSRVSPEEFELAISRAVEELPRDLRDLAGEVPVLVEDFPSPELAAPAGAGELPLPPDTFGLFAGTSRLERSYLNPIESPAAIFLFKGNLERACGNHATLTREIEVTLRHELAHYLGFEEEDMPELGLE